MYLKDITGTLGSELAGKRIALCVTASVSITEAPRIARFLMRHGAEVISVLTPKAGELVSPMIFEWSTGNQPITKLTGRVEHVELVSTKSSKKVDLILIAPCTANTLGKISSGISDEPVSTLACTALGSQIPILIACAMHEPMLNNPLIQEAKRKLGKAGVKFIEGKTIESKSKLAEPEVIVQAVISEIAKSNEDFKNEERIPANLKLIITAGPTREPIDKVRFISNPSSGKMGVALAEEALLRGAKRVCLVHGPGVTIPEALSQRGYKGGVKLDTYSVLTNQEMQDAVISELSKESGEHSVLISAGAPADYTNLRPARGKLSTTKKPVIKLELAASKKIISIAKEKFPKTFVVAFKADHDKTGPKKLYQKALELSKISGADLVIANDVGRSDIGFGSDFNEVLVVSKDGKKRNLARASKNEIASEILTILVEEMHQRSLP